MGQDLDVPDSLAFVFQARAAIAGAYFLWELTWQPVHVLGATFFPAFLLLLL